MLIAEPPTITVTAPVVDAATSARAGAYVRAVLATPFYGQYARWADPVCLRVAGLEDVPAARVTARFTGIATEAGVRIAKPGCKPNLQLVFTEDAANTTRIITRKRPRQIARLNADARQTLLTAPLPIRWWHGLEVRDRDGQRAAANGSAALMSASGSGGMPLANSLPVGPDAVMTDNRSGSLINTNIAVWATSAVVIVDVTLAAGKQLDAVADYAALAALAPMKLPPPVPGVPSILGLFAADGTAEALSRWDRAWLAALYRIPMNRNGNRQRGDMTARMAATMAAPTQD